VSSYLGGDLTVINRSGATEKKPTKVRTRRRAPLRART
jgi:hypothetical protein